MPLIRAPLLVFRRGFLVLFADFEVMRGRCIKGETIQNSIVVEQIGATGKPCLSQPAGANHAVE
jgi:hypothetical protein